MLASISPLGERARNNRWPLTVAAYTVASVAAGAVFGAVLGSIGLLVGPSRPVQWVVVALAAGAAGAIDLASPQRLPSVRRQVNEDWLVTYRGWVYGAGFGAQLGVGVVTIVTTATLYAWVAATVVTASTAGGALAGAAFGAARAMPFAAMAGADTPARLRAIVGRQAGWSAAARVAAAACALAMSAAAVVAAVAA